MSVGLLVVQLFYRFYVRVHLSKWFTFFCFCHSFVCRIAVFYTCSQLTYINTFFLLHNPYQDITTPFGPFRNRTETRVEWDLAVVG